MIEHAQVEAQARAANARDLWDRAWQSADARDWRAVALSRVYTRIARLIPRGASVVDLGGGVGGLADVLIRDAGSFPQVWDHSDAALEIARAKNHSTRRFDLEAPYPDFPGCDEYVTATEVFEHLSEAARSRLLSAIQLRGCRAFISIPNDRLGPDEEPQHTIRWTAKQFLDVLRHQFGEDRCRVEVLGPYLLGVVGFVPRRHSMLSVCTPARDEAEDLEAVLASFRGVADELVVGVDPRTTDNTREVAAKYADVVFDLVEPQGPPEERMPDAGVHFAWIRNQCIDRCTGDWIFMSEAHERLHTGEDVLLQLDRVMPKGAKVGFVLRQGAGQQWAFPWLFRRDPSIRFIRAVHNALDYPPGTYAVKLPQVRTLHDRAKDRELARVEQRKVQNRKHLTDDWLSRQNENSLFYLAQEWRTFDPRRAVEKLEEFLRVSNNGVQRYQARLILAKEYALADRAGDARDVLLGATADDWSRTEHWLWLGDLEFEAERFEQAHAFYRYATTTIGEPPFTVWWIDLFCYSYLPAQRMAMVCAELGRLEESLAWGRRVLELLPEEAPHEMLEEARANVQLLEHALEGEALQ